MGRQARNDAAGHVYHVMARGIEGTRIFRDRRDRDNFLERLEELLPWGGLRLLAWCLMGTHFHMMVQRGPVRLGKVMGRLLTGYATWYNKRHRRWGHLFGNRYKSPEVKSQSHYAELIRYIHLNPVRARIVRDARQLGRYPYTGHAVVLGTRALQCQDRDGLLKLFSRRSGEALREYRRYVREGVGESLSAELEEVWSGGKPGRPRGSKSDLRGGRRRKQRSAGRSVVGGASAIRSRPGRTVEAVLRESCREGRVSRGVVLGASRERKVCAVRRAFLLRACQEAGTTQRALAELCGISTAAVCKAIQKAREHAGQ